MLWHCSNSGQRARAVYLAALGRTERPEAVQLRSSVRLAQAHARLSAADPTLRASLKAHGLTEQHLATVAKGREAAAALRVLEAVRPEEVAQALAQARARSGRPAKRARR